MKKSLLLTGAAILLLGIAQKFDGHETTQSHRQLPIGGKALIEQQRKMEQAPFVSRQEPDRWATDQTLPYQDRMTKLPEQRDYRANATIAGKTLAQHELSAGVDTAWVRHYASGLAPSDDEATAIAVDGSGNTYVTGSNVIFPSGHDYLTVKYDPSGTQLWVARYNGPGDAGDWAKDIAVDASGNVYVTGESGGDYATVKYNSDGVQQWVARYQGYERGNEATALSLDASGNVYVTGKSEGLDTGKDYTTIKYNSVGVEQWVARYNGSGNAGDWANDLAVDASGNVYVTGTSFDSTTWYDYATVKYNSDGVQQWVSRYNGPGNDYDDATTLAVDGTGNFYVTGWSVGSGTGGDYATVKYNSAGVEQWVARYNGLEGYEDWATALVLDNSDNVYITGNSDGSSWYGFGSGYYTTIKYNSSGVEQWVAHYKDVDSLGNEATALAVDASGNVYVTGRSGMIYYAHLGFTGGDYFTVKYDSAGAEQWIARYNGPGDDEDCATALAMDGTGNVYVTGTSVGSGTGFDYATVKYNSTGAQKWVARYNGQNSLDEATTLAVDGSGNVFVTGKSRGSGTDYDYATVKYNSVGVEQWVARYNGSANCSDEITALAVDISGNVYVTGASADSTTWPYYYAYATIKYNSAGVVQWVARYNGPGNAEDEATALVVDSSGNVYVTGRSVGSVTGYDYATIKYNTDGVQQWLARYNGPENRNDRVAALAVDASGNVYVTGGSECGGSGIDDYATVKYNSDGVEQWVVRYNGPGNLWDWAKALAVDASGNVYVTGQSHGLGTDDYDYATIKYNSAGIEQWVARYKGPGNVEDDASALAVDSSGNVYVTGESGGDYTTVKYNSEGVQQWVARYNEPENPDEATALAVDTDGNVYVTGTSAGDYATVKYNSAGVEQWVARYNGPGNSGDRASALAMDSSGNVYVTGTSEGDGWSVYTTIKYVQTLVSVEKEEPGRPSRYWLAQNYPNPFNPSTAISYQLSAVSFVDLSIYNSLGQKVATLVSEKQAAGHYSVVWDATGFSAGVYFCRMEAGNYLKVIKLALVK
jgi:uncharacterized delta-60 repeat protein